MDSLPTIIKAEYGGSFRIRVEFNDGTRKTVDFRQWLEGPVFQPLLDVEYFRQFRIEGGTVAWPNGADVAPETIYRAAEASEAA